MIRFLVNAAIFFATAAIGLLVANLILDDMTMDAAGWLLAAIIFALIQAVLSPFFVKVTRRNASALLGAVGLLTTFVALVITTAVTSGLSIDGAATWFWATLIVWLASMIAAFILPLLLAKWIVEEVRED